MLPLLTTALPSNLIQKYNVAGPRYTSYPTVPFWEQEKFKPEDWVPHVQNTFSTSNHTSGISLYIHLPYCESLCTFCACHKRITKNHQVEEPYIEALLKEWSLYQSVVQEKSILSEIHLGGGTPSFFSPRHLAILIEGLLKDAKVADNHEFGFEGHPNNTTGAHLQTLFDLGFRRVSFGVQDYTLQVQKAIHRIQPFEQVKQVTELARQIGYTSISHDLVFGLPFQTVHSIQDTIKQTISLRPDRLAFYSYAHVPWLKGNGQRGFEDNDLPTGTQKRELYEIGRSLLEENGYVEIGMDHFALPTDSMTKAMEEGALHRNFMGYTTTQSKLLVGLGASAISDAWSAFAQNLKGIDEYIEEVHKGVMPLLKGHSLTSEDLFIRQQILNLICHFETSWAPTDWTPFELNALIQRLTVFEEDGLIEFSSSQVKVLPQGRPFIRNICMAFDIRLLRANPTQRLFSQTI